MKQVTDRRCVPFCAAPAAPDRGTLLISRRLLLVALPMSLAAFESMPSWLGGGPRGEKISPQAAQLVQWVRSDGRDPVLDPAAPRIMRASTRTSSARSDEESRSERSISSSVLQQSGTAFPC